MFWIEICFTYIVCLQEISDHSESKVDEIKFCIDL